ncbi:MAG: response regulator [Thermodesulfobacteriota bacterium]
MKTILIIDDDVIFRGMLKKLLEREGYGVVEADNGNSGVAVFQESQPDLVVCDLIMPNKEGIETIVDLQKINDQVPIIAVSGGGRMGPEAYLSLAKGLGAREVFSKPFVHKDFLKTISSCL